MTSASQLHWAEIELNRVKYIAERNQALLDASLQREAIKDGRIADLVGQIRTLEARLKDSGDVRVRMP